VRATGDIAVIDEIVCNFSASFNVKLALLPEPSEKPFDDDEPGIIIMTFVPIDWI
jgi:hypothetical protein